MPHQHASSGGVGGPLAHGATPAEACVLLTNTLVAAGERGAMRVGSAADELFDRLRGPTLECVSSVGHGVGQAQTLMGPHPWGPTVGPH